MIALILLASGTSNRFGADNKLLAPLRGRPIITYSAQLWLGRHDIDRIAVVPTGETELAQHLEQANWEQLPNPAPHLGQANSLKLGLRRAEQLGARSLVICLADMPFVTDQHLDAVHAALDGHDAVMTKSDGIFMPPAAFAQTAFDALQLLEGDMGARAAFHALPSTTTVSLDAQLTRDVDTPQMLDALNKEVRA